MKEKDPYASFRHPEFRIFLLVRFALVFAWSMQFVVIEWEVYRLTKDPLSLGIIGLMEVIPAVSLALFAGHIVDQREKRNLLLITTLAFATLSGLLVYLTSAEASQRLAENQILLCIYGVVFLGGIVRAFISPTVFSLMALVVPKELYSNAATWSSSVWQISGVLGPALAGFCISWIGTNGSMFIILAFVLIALAATLQINKKPIMNDKIGQPVLDSLKEGIQFVYKTKAILGALTLDMVAVLFGGAVALLPIFATDILNVGSEGFGILRAAPAIGAFLTMFIVAYFPLDKHAGKKLLVAVFGFGLCIIAFGLSTSFWISVFALFMSGVTDGVSMVIRQTILQLYTPDNMRGRVSSVSSIFIASSNELGAFESGFTAKFMGTVTAVVFGGTMTLVTVGITGLVSPALRDLDFEEEFKQPNNDD